MKKSLPRTLEELELYNNDTMEAFSLSETINLIIILVCAVPFIRALIALGGWFAL